MYLLLVLQISTSDAAIIPQNTWTLKYVDSAEIVGENGAARNAFDGNSATIWHTQWLNTSPSTPHEIQIDLGLTYDVSGFSCLPRQDGVVNGRIGQYEFYVSSDGLNWDIPVVSGTFINNATAKEVLFTKKTGRYVRLRALTEVNGKPWTSLAELNVIGELTVASTIIPKSGWTITYVDSQELVGENGAAINILDGKSATLWHTQWLNGSPLPPHELRIDLGLAYSIDGFRYLPRQDGGVNGRIGQYEFYVSSDGVIWGTPVATGVFANSATEKVVPFSATSGRFIKLRALSEVNGKAWTSMAELNITGRSAGIQPPDGIIKSASQLIPKTGWSITYVDSQELIGENGAAVNALDGSTATFWHTQWLSNNTPPPHEIQIDLGHVYSIDRFRYLPRQDGGVNGRIGLYEFYVSSDGVSWGTPVATGSFANSATEKEVSFAAKTGRFVRLRALSEVNGKPWTCMADLNLFGVADSTGTSITVSGTALITANAIDNIGVAKVEFYVNGSLAATVTAVPYSISWNTTTVVNGSYIVSAKAYDAAGNVGQSLNVNVVVIN